MSPPWQAKSLMMRWNLFPWHRQNAAVALVETNHVGHPSRPCNWISSKLLGVAGIHAEASSSCSWADPCVAAVTEIEDPAYGCQMGTNVLFCSAKQDQVYPMGVTGWQVVMCYLTF
jgi:hypothetical protein